MNYGGMTVNERLYVSGLTDAFDKAVENKNTEEVISIPKKVELDDTNIDDILKQFKLRDEWL